MPAAQRYARDPSPNLLDPRDDLWIVTTDDRRLFSCHVEAVGAQRHWIFVATDRVRHVGPVWQGPLRAADLQTLVNDWWNTEKGFRPHGFQAVERYGRAKT